MRARLILPLLVLLLAASAAQAQLATQKSSANGVTVAVTPVNLAPGAKTWDFTVVLDTHTQDLSDDLAKSALLLGELEAGRSRDLGEPGPH